MSGNDKSKTHNPQIFIIIITNFSNYITGVSTFRTNDACGQKVLVRKGYSTERQLTIRKCGHYRTVRVLYSTDSRVQMKKSGEN